MDRTDVKKIETDFLVGESKKHPELFERETHIDSPGFLEKIGIFFGNDDILPKGYLKLWPQDFIVEEITDSGELQTVNSGDFFDKNKSFFEKDPTIYATLVKCKLPSFEATRDLANFLKIEPQKIKSAGIKDADAITSQLISIRGANVDKLKGISSPHYFIKNVYSSNGALEVGSLQGNRFTILVRTGKDFDKESFSRNLERIKKDGFYNFFYTQRFANPRFVNWFWGLLVLKGEYKNAILSFLSFGGQREMTYFKNVRAQLKEYFDDWDKIAKIISPFSSIMQNENKVVRYLQDNPTDFIGALKQIKDQVQLWVFAYGSLLFNRKISQYISSGEIVPEKLPLILNTDQKDWEIYYDFLQEDGIKSMPIKNLAPFSEVIQFKKRELKTKQEVKIHKVEILPEGVIMSFTLNKGCYATTFLSHLFQLVTGRIPEDILNKEIDIKEVLSENSIGDVVEKFKSVTFSKVENIFGKEE